MKYDIELRTISEVILREYTGEADTRNVDFNGVFRVTGIAGERVIVHPELCNAVAAFKPHPIDNPSVVLVYYRPVSKHRSVFENLPETYKGMDVIAIPSNQMNRYSHIARGII